MVGFLLRAAIAALGLWVASQLLDGLHFATPSKLLLAAVLLGIVNAFVRPLAFILTLPITTLGVASERDLVNQLPSMPRVYDGACLVWLMYSGAATVNNASIFGHVDFGWS